MHEEAPPKALVLPNASKGHGHSLSMKAVEPRDCVSMVERARRRTDEKPMDSRLDDGDLARYGLHNAP